MNDGMTVTEKDELIMKLVHYFVTKENYAPIMVKGVKNEIWLENLEANYKIVRINSNYIHNNEQFEYDIYKILGVNKQISKRTLSRKLKTLNILTDTNEDLKTKTIDNIDNFIIRNTNDLKNKQGIITMFPLIIEDNIDNLHGIDFLLNISNDINKKTASDNEFYENVFKPKKIIVTKILILINVFIFVFNILAQLTSKFDLIYYFGLNSNYVKLGQIYRLITCGFLHANILHLLCNMYSLYIIGSQIESFIGKKKFIFIYFISMITGSLLSCIITNSWSVGASGAIFGLMGSLVYFGYHYRIYLGSVLTQQLLPILIANIVIGFMIPGIDVSAHIGGLTGGILSTMAVGITKKTKKSERINGTICLIVLLCFLVFLLLK